ncbi:RNA polymerase sigma factor [Urbifossiella limnaea]|uniref:ECF RNA polymerase sigma factor SigL n=1 Tax=Urbifossiella limnaea TaxID=2528023 RepID=A0A517XL79_9BACT|nr:sigma-70 family RNA polymerase sigma factor [Urbifossiella limnaea]QDU18267.1 ECF RNA polymerase sigma factor SigL [Urbifossiella limnaea]
MPDEFNTLALEGLLVRLRAGDPAARDEIIRACQKRLEALARKMLRKYPAVRRWAETGDVFVAAALKLLKALEKVPVADTRAFFGLAARIIRNELIDLARHFLGPRGIGANHASDPGQDTPEPAAPADDPAELERMAAFHEAVEDLPAEEREVVGLMYYHGWTQAQIAELLDRDERTVRRRYCRAVELLAERLGDNYPTG